jgi:hypothetical protein
MALTGKGRSVLLLKEIAISANTAKESVRGRV